MPGKTFINCYVDRAKRARIDESARRDGVGPQQWLSDAIDGALRVSEQLYKAKQMRARWKPFEGEHAGMREITADLAAGRIQSDSST